MYDARGFYQGYYQPAVVQAPTYTPAPGYSGFIPTSGVPQIQVNLNQN